MAPPASSMSPVAIDSAAPVLCRALPSPNAAVITINIDQSTLRPASRPEVQPVIIINPAASSDAFNILSQPDATDNTINTSIIIASMALWYCGGLVSSSSLTRKKSRELRCCSANEWWDSSNRVSPGRNTISPIF